MSELSHANIDGQTAINLTPMMKQYLEVKAEHPKALLFFRLGDFYELFFDDAVRASELLQITLTSRSKGVDRVPMAGVPYHAARRYIARLIESGENVAICEQLEPPGKGIVKREVVRVISPGMVLDDEVLEARENNFLASVLPPENGELWGAALLDASTGEFIVVQPATHEIVAEEIARVSPREILTAAGMEGRLQTFLQSFSKRPALATLPMDAFQVKRAQAYLKDHLRVSSLEGFGVEDAGVSLGAAGAALRYLKDTQKSTADHIDRLSLQRQGSVLVIDEASRTNLELIRSAQDGGRAGSLLSIVDRSSTSLGARTLSRWLTAPLVDLQAISARLDAVAELVQKATWREEISNQLKQVADGGR